MGVFSGKADDDDTFLNKLIEFSPELKSSLDICRAYASHSFLLKLNIITG